MFEVISGSSLIPPWCFGFSLAAQVLKWCQLPACLVNLVCVLNWLFMKRNSRLLQHSRLLKKLTLELKLQRQLLRRQ
jgi:hypothetical protein